jgi:hypothetical protein
MDRELPHQDEIWRHFKNKLSRDGVGKLPLPPPLLEDWADTQHGIYCPVLVVPLPQLAEIDILSVQWNL